MIISKKYEPLFKSPSLNDDVDTFILTGGRFSAKSFSVAAAIGYFIKNFSYKVLFTRYTLTSAKDSIIPEFLGAVENLGITQQFEVNTDRVTHSQGGQVVFKGMKTSSGNQTASLKSLKGFNVLVVDEAEELPNRKDLEKIQLSIRHPEKKNITILILNPSTKEHWIYKKYFESKGINGGYNGIKDNVCYIHTSYLDCLEHVPKNILSEFERMKRDRPKEYNNIVLGGWLDKAEGVILPNWSTGAFDTSLPYVYGLDFGFSPDPTAMVKVAVDSKSKKIYVHECIYNLELSTDQIESKIRSEITKENDLIVADHAEKRLIIELKARGLNVAKCKKGVDSIKKGIKDLQSFDIIVTKNSINLQKELNNYVWNDKKSGIPIDKYNHLIDALRYGFERANRTFYAG